MKARLFAPTGEFSSLDVTGADSITVGRRPENDLCIASPRISGRHALLQWNEESRGWYVEDLKSTNGTFLGGIAIRAPERLHDLDLISFGGVEFVFQVLHGSAERREDTTVPDDRTVIDAPDPDKTVYESRPPKAPDLDKD